MVDAPTLVLFTGINGSCDFFCLFVLKGGLFGGLSFQCISHPTLSERHSDELACGLSDMAPGLIRTATD